MTIKTKCIFTYGHTIDANNQIINFNEGSGEISASIIIGEYTLQSFGDAVASAMNLAGSQDYSVAVDRTTRKLTLSAASSFTLLAATGSQIEISAFALMGYTLDISGISNEGDQASGSAYRPQFLLQDFIDFQDDVESSHSKVNQSATGIVEVISYGSIEFMSCVITFATDILKQAAIENNANGVADLRAFMKYSVGKAPLEFVPDADNNPSAFTDCLLERTPQSKDGVNYMLKELYSRNLVGYFETGKLKFRKIQG